MQTEQPERATTLSWPSYRCPEHQEPLETRDDGLACPRGHAFPVVRGIPRFVEADKYTAAFGAQWNRYRRTQLDSYTGTTISRDRAKRCIGEEVWRSLEDSQILEAGCGAGRFTEVLLERGAPLTSVDLSTAVDANAANFPPGPRHRIAQADVTDLPFGPDAFHLVVCLGVVPFTPSPERTIEALYRHVRPGGHLVFDHFTYSLGMLGLPPLLRFYFRRLTPEAGIQKTEKVVDLLLPLHKRAGKLTPLLTRISPVYSYYRIHPELPDEVQREWALLDTNNALTPWYRRVRTCRQLLRVLDGLGAEVIRCERAGNGIEVRVRKPSKEAGTVPARTS